MNSKSTIVRAILMDASECERPEAEHPATIEISAEDLQRILERHITAAPQATPFMWAIQEPGGGAYMDDGCVSSVRADVQAEVDGLNSGLDADDDPYQVVPVYLAAAPQAVQAAAPTHELKAILADADIGPPVDTDGCCLECGNWTPWHHPEAHDHEDDCSAPRQYAQRRNWKARLSALIAATPAHPAEGVPAQAVQPPEGGQDVAETQHPEWMLVHKVTGAQKPLDIQWTVRAALAATLPAAQGIDAKELLTALDDLSFACFAGIGTKAPDVDTYNRTFAVLQKHRDAAQAKQRGDSNDAS
jgi:hypothetical protein